MRWITESKDRKIRQALIGCKTKTQHIRNVGQSEDSIDMAIRAMRWFGQSECLVNPKIRAMRWFGQSEGSSDVKIRSIRRFERCGVLEKVGDLAIIAGDVDFDRKEVVEVFGGPQQAGILVVRGIGGKVLIPYAQDALDSGFA